MLESISAKYRSYLLFFILVSFYCYALALQLIPELFSVQLQFILQSDFITVNQLQASFFYTYVPFQLLAGILYDRFKGNDIFITGILVCAISASLLGLANAYLVALLSELLLGIGSALVTVGCFILTSYYFHKNKFATLTSSFIVLLALNLLIANNRQFFIFQTNNWKILFFLLSMLGLLLAIAALRVLPKESTEEKDNVGQEIKSVFRYGENWIAILYSFAVWMPTAIFGSVLGIPYLQARYGLSVSAVLPINSMIWLGLICGAPLVARLSDYWRCRRPLLIACALLGLIAIMGTLFIRTIPISVMYLLMAMLGFATAGQNLALSIMNDHNPIQHKGTAFGLNSLAVLLGGMLFHPLISQLLNWHWNGQLQNHVPIYNLFVYQRTLLVLVPCYIIALYVSVLLLREEKQGN